jgi:hypothetical protein
MDLLDFLNLILILIIFFLLFKEEPLIEKLFENDKIQFALAFLQLFTMPITDATKNYLFFGSAWTFKVDKLWIDDTILIQDNGKGKLSVTKSPVNYTPYRN